MKKILANKYNFFFYSEANFKEVKNAPSSEPDYISYRTFVKSDYKCDERIRNSNGEIVKVLIYDRDEYLDHKLVIAEFDVVETFIMKNGYIGHRLKTNDISSRYWYTQYGVYRESDHWGKCGKCTWKLDGKSVDGDTKIGFCYWQDIKIIAVKDSIPVTIPRFM